MIAQPATPETALAGFHPIVREWFRTRFPQATAAQAAGWPVIHSGQDTLIAAPTGSGKTLAAFLCAIDRFVRRAVSGDLNETGTRVVYVSPLKALSNDIQKNLAEPLREIQAMVAAAGHSDMPEIRVGVRTGDTSSSQRAAIVRKPPHILVTTPESLYLMLTAERSREILRDVDTVIVDEIHAVARDKRGSHLALSLERLHHLTIAREAKITADDGDANPDDSARDERSDAGSVESFPGDRVASPGPQRIGLSATQKPIETIAAFLTGCETANGSAGTEDADATRIRPCAIVDTGHIRDLDLAVEVPPSELSAVCSHEQWAEVHDRLCELIEEHTSTILFVNSRTMAERIAHHLRMRIGEEAVASHHGSLSKETRLKAEERLKAGQLRAIVATASLELGIDIGHVDLVCQIGSPRSIAAFLQRVGRSGHAVGALPKGRLFALTRDELVESLALIRAIRLGRLDPVVIPESPLDILAQQIVAAVACEEWDTSALYEMLRRAYSYRNLSRAEFDEVIDMLARGYGDRSRTVAYLYHDAINGRVRARRSARIVALTSGGAIPEQPLYRVVNIEDNTFVGTLDEDYATEIGAGTIFLLGNTSWQIIHTRGLTVTVRDAHGAPPGMPFWFGEAPGRTLELSTAVSELREGVARHLNIANAGTAQNANDLSPTRDETDSGSEHSIARAISWLAGEVSDNPHANRQAVEYVAVQQAALGIVPTQKQIVFERFFDETGGMQLVIHAPFGTRINRAWGLALRKRFCRSFDFELQASADDDGVVLSLGPNQSFPIEQLFGFLTPDNVRPLLEQAFLQVPFFRTRWQWNANRSLAVLRNRMGKRVAPALQRMRGDDLLTSVFPASTQCFEHITGDIELPDHPLVRETMRDCLTDAADLNGLSHVLEEIRTKKITLSACDTREPSPFAYERLNASPYAFLDDAGLLERRTRALSQRRVLPIEELRDLTWLDEEAIARVAAEAWPTVRDADELHDVLYTSGLWPVCDAFGKADESGEAADWNPFYEDLYKSGRAGALRFADGRAFWFAVEQIEVIRAAYQSQLESTTIARESERIIAPAAEIDLPTAPGSPREHAHTFAAPPRLDEAPDSVAAKAFLLSGQLAVRPMQTAAELAQLLAFPHAGLEIHLEGIEASGGILRGRWRRDPKPDAPDEAKSTTAALPLQWCDRRLLQRIHRLTLTALRDRIRPVSPREYLAYLIERHRVQPESRYTGKDGLLAALMQLQGFETAAGEWEAAILPTRVADYDPRWLDELTLSGLLTYGRMRAPGPEKKNDDDDRANSRPAARGMSRGVPFAFALREDLEWIYPEVREAAEKNLSERAAQILAALESGGAQFTTELRARTKLSAADLDSGLGELARKGCITADGFAALRAYVSPAFRRRDRVRRNLSPRGRVAVFPGPLPQVEGEERLRSWAALLLERYGVVCRDILTRESLAPAWGALLPIFRNLEARGEIRGGRFITGVSGEQFALPKVIEELRALRENFAATDSKSAATTQEAGDARTTAFAILSAADPLNLIGILTDGERVPANRNTRLVFQAGRHVATHEAGELEYHLTVSIEDNDRILAALNPGVHFPASQFERTAR
ncbi:MAG: DEAD/DEAH box helicase [bacterium]|nr:DEAD/DEAH box helicase [bacterium]